MRKFVFVVIVLLSFVSFASVSAAKERCYTIKSAIIEYALSGSNAGTEVLYFSDYGKKEARYTNTVVKMFGIKKETNSVAYMDGDWMYGYDPKTNIATKINVGEMADEMVKHSGARSRKEFGEQMLKEMNGKVIGKKKILGKSCDIWEAVDWGTTTCVYKKSIPLETTVNFAGMSVYTVATSFKENVPIPRDKLELPKTAQIQDGPDMKEMMGKGAAAGKAAGVKDMANFSDMIKAMKSAGQAQKEMDTTNEIKNTFGGLKSMFGK